MSLEISGKNNKPTEITTIMLERIIAAIEAGKDGSALTTYSEVTKGLSQDAQGLPREAFMKVYQQLVNEPFNRVLQMRISRLNDALRGVLFLCMQSSPPEDKVMMLHEAMQLAMQNPYAIKACLDAFTPYLEPEGAQACHATIKTLLPSLYEQPTNRQAD